MTAVVVGATAHILGDMLTPEGCLLLWPAPRPRFELPLVRTDGLIERGIILPARTLTLYRPIITLTWPAWRDLMAT